MPDTRASGVLSVKEPQFKALRKINLKVQLDILRARKHKIRFKKKDLIAL
jgi:hypothetical protein